MTDFTLQPSTAYIEREIVTAMIVSDRALRQIGLTYKPRYLAAEFAQVVAGWCLQHQERYGRAPGRDIRTMFEANRRDGLDEESARDIGQFLQGISQEFERQGSFNEQLAIDEALRYFRERALALLRDDLDYWLEGGNVNQAHAAVAEWVAPAGTASPGLEPLADKEGIMAAFAEDDGLLSLPGPLGRMLNGLERDNTIAIVGKYKATKSFTSQYIGFNALFGGLNVGWMDFEMGQKRIYRRIFQAACAMPLRAPKDGALVLPAWDCAHNQDNSCARPERTCRVGLLYVNDDTGKQAKPRWDSRPAGYLPCDACRDWSFGTWFVERRGLSQLGWSTAWAKAKAISGSVMGARLKVMTWPKFSAGYDDVRAVLNVWRHLEGFVPDVLIIDQPSGMKLAGRGDTRHQIDDLWKRLCGIAPELHCLTILPSQAGGKEAQARRRLRDHDFAEHAGIGGHVDGSIKIDMDDEDKAAMRVWISMGYDRDDRSPEGYCCVLQALDLGQPVLDSRLV